jgi:hypothetical protein
MAPILFLVLMSAFVETLEVEWKNAEIEVCTVQSYVGEKLKSGEGKLQGHLPKEYMARMLTAVKILQCLYLNDGAFIFASRADMTRGLALVYCHFGRLGLEMHIGQREIPSKTECVFFPPPSFFDSHMPALPAQKNDNEINNALGYGEDALTNDEQCAEGKEGSCRKKHEELYDELEEMQPITVDDELVSFCRHFKYLGSFVSFSLCNNYNVKKCVTAATQSIGVLKNIWNSPHLDIWSKYLLFGAIPINLQLWGCKTWSMQKALSNKLEVFLHRNIWLILRISIMQVQDERIHNEHVRKMFYDIP